MIRFGCGHAKTPENVSNYDGKERCRSCQRARNLAYMRKVRGQTPCSFAGNEADNLRVLKILEAGPQYHVHIAKQMKQSPSKVQARLYRLEKAGRVAHEGDRVKDRRHQSARWGLPGQLVVASKDDKKKLVQSRSAPDWRGTTLNYDFDYHRRLCLLTR